MDPSKNELDDIEIMQTKIIGHLKKTEQELTSNLSKKSYYLTMSLSNPVILLN